MIYMHDDDKYKFMLYRSAILMHIGQNKIYSLHKKGSRIELDI